MPEPIAREALEERVAEALENYGKVRGTEWAKQDPTVKAWRRKQARAALAAIEEVRGVEDVQCLVAEWDEHDEVYDDCELPRGHKGAHAHERADGTQVYWRDDGKDVLTGEPQSVAEAREAYDDAANDYRESIRSGHGDLVALEDAYNVAFAVLGVAIRAAEREVQGARTLADLAREQGLDPNNPPDYFALADALFPTEEDAEEFQRYITELRHPVQGARDEVLLGVLFDLHGCDCDGSYKGARWRASDHASNCPAYERWDAFVERALATSAPPQETPEKSNRAV